MCICVLFELESLWFSGFSFIPTGPSQILSLNSTSSGNKQIYHTLLQSKILDLKKQQIPILFNLSIHTLMLAHMHRHTHTYQKASLHKLPIISAALNCRCVCVCATSSGCAWIRWIINLLVALTLCLIAVPEQLTHAHTKGRINRVTHREEHDDTHSTVTHKSLCVFFHKSRAWNPHTVKRELFIEIKKRRQAFYCFFEFSWAI